MRVVVALGGNALQKRGERMTVDNQRANVPSPAERSPRSAWTTRSSSATATARRSGCWHCRRPPTARRSPIRFDVLGAQTEGMIGYFIEQELGNLLPFEKPLATILTMTEVDRRRPGVRRPEQVRRARSTTEADGASVRRREGLGRQGGRRRSGAGSSPVPMPKRIFEIRPIRWLLDQGAIVSAPAAAASRRCTTAPGSSQASRP